MPSTSQDIIDVGGDRYYLRSSPNKTDRKQIIALNIRSRALFEKYYGPEKDTKDLLKKYLYYGHPIELEFETANDKQKVLEIVTKRHKNLKETISKRKQRYIKDIILVKKYESISDLIEYIKIAEVVTENDTLQTLEPDQIYKVMIHLAWYLMHKNNVPSEIVSSWNKVTQHVLKSSMSDIIDGIKLLEDTSPTISNYMKPFNLMNNTMKYTNGVQQMLRNKNNTKKNTKVDATTAKLKKRLETILLALESRKYLSSHDEKDDGEDAKLQELLIMNPLYTEPVKAAPATAAPATAAPATAAPAAIKGGGTLLQTSFDPIFSFLKMEQPELYAKVERKLAPIKKRLTDDHKDHPAVINPLLKLVSICNTIYDYDVALYKINNVPLSLLQFLRFYITGDKNSVTMNGNDKPPVQVQTNPTVDLQKSSKKRFIYIFTVGSNIEKKETVKETQNIFILSSETEFTQNTFIDYKNLFEIDYNNITVGKGSEFSGTNYSIDTKSLLDQRELVMSILFLIKSIL